MKKVALSTADWEATAHLARTFADRLLGVWGAPTGATVVLPVGSVHSFGRRQPLEVAGLDASMRVTSVKTLPPNRLIIMPGARMVIEAPAGAPLPSVGDRVEMTDV
jgi:uncharacterized membrane protein (UPF0127 family)